MVNDGVVVRHGVADRAHENEFFRYFAKSIKTYFDKKKDTRVADWHARMQG